MRPAIIKVLTDNVCKTRSVGLPTKPDSVVIDTWYVTRFVFVDLNPVKFLSLLIYFNLLACLISVSIAFVDFAVF